ncbi:MAG TPA: VOC family protein [Methylomirabilota bacterium]|nr:VOC family protein [Methylomirabilota bacterium]
MDKGHLPQLPLRLHHYAYVTKDQEANRRFFEDVLGIPLVATWCERAYTAELGRELEYCHTFYSLGDGSALAFFQFAEPDLYEKCKTPHPALGRFDHIAVKVDQKTYDELERRLAAAGIARRHTDHGYCQSLYVMTPDELKLEFTVDPRDVDAIAATRRADAHAELERWLAGDRRPNNEMYGRPSTGSGRAAAPR